MQSQSKPCTDPRPAPPPLLLFALAYLPLPLPAPARGAIPQSFLSKLPFPRKPTS
jgi:hypothetical protein